ncbi:Unknown protein, partial [Striga hermonthica]
TVNPQARDETLEQLLAQVRDLQARVEGRKTGGPRGHPFSQHILDADLPQGFRDLNISYDGSTDPSRHMRSFENMAVFHRYNDSVQCRAFLKTLRGSAQDWFHQLPAGAIKDFEGFSSSFLNQFASVRPQEKSYLTLMGIQQKEGESLRDYVARYTRACVEVPRASEEIKAGGLTRGLLPGLCRNSLAKRPGRTFDEVLGRCAKYMNVEEAEADFSRAVKVTKTDPRDERREKRGSSTGETNGSPRAEKDGRPRSWRPTQYTPLAAPQARILEVMEREIRKHAKVEVHQVDEGGPVMNFGPADVGEVERPHNDALMITAQVSGYEVQRIFVDTGSSVNVIFYDCLKRMDLDIELSPLHTSLFGFNGSEVAPLGEATLAVVLGEGDLRKVKMIRFVVVDVESAYNVILGRPALNAFQAVVSTYHMKLKFPVGDRVGEARGDKKLSRACYQIAIKTNQKTEVREGKKPTPSEKRPMRSDLKPHGELIEIQIGEREDQTTKIGGGLEKELKRQLVELLKEFRD